MVELMLPDTREEAVGLDREFLALEARRDDRRHRRPAYLGANAREAQASFLRRVQIAAELQPWIHIDAIDLVGTSRVGHKKSPREPDLWRREADTVCLPHQFQHANGHFADRLVDARDGLRTLSKDSGGKAEDLKQRWVDGHTAMLTRRDRVPQPVTIGSWYALCD